MLDIAARPEKWCRDIVAVGPFLRRSHAGSCRIGKIARRGDYDRAALRNFAHALGARDQAAA
jgi:hypothetical protein